MFSEGFVKVGKIKQSQGKLTLWRWEACGVVLVRYKGEASREPRPPPGAASSPGFSLQLRLALTREKGVREKEKKKKKSLEIHDSFRQACFRI